MMLCNIFILAGNVFCPITSHVYWLRKHYIYANGYVEKNVKPIRAYSQRTKRSYVCCSSNPQINHFLPSETELLNGKVIYSVAAAMGHNKVCRPCFFCMEEFYLRHEPYTKPYY